MLEAIKMLGYSIAMEPVEVNGNIFRLGVLLPISKCAIKLC